MLKGRNSFYPGLQEPRAQEDLDQIKNWKELDKGRMELLAMLPRHFHILDLYLQGMLVKDIAAELRVSHRNVNLVIKSPVFQEELSRRRGRVERELDQDYSDGIKKAQEILNEAAADAAQFHVDLVKNAEEETRLRQISAKEILDRALGSEKIKASNVVLSIDQLNLLSVALRESRESVELKHLEPIEGQSPSETSNFELSEAKSSGEDK